MSKPGELKYKKIIWVLSIAIPVAVALLFLVRIPNVEPLNFLPPIYATINGLTALLLIIVDFRYVDRAVICFSKPASGFSFVRSARLISSHSNNSESKIIFYAFFKSI